MVKHSFILYFRHTLHRLIGNLMLLLRCLRLLVLPLQVFQFGHSHLVQLMLT